MLLSNKKKKLEIFGLKKNLSVIEYKPLKYSLISCPEQVLS